MPVVQVSISDASPAVSVAFAISEIENGNGEVVSCSQVGDVYMIVYKNKPRPGRPPKETRG